MTSGKALWMENLNAAEEDWELLKTFFPSRWKELATETAALKGLRQDKSEEKYLRVLLMHLGGGLSLRETAARAKQANLADLSDVALLKRVRKSKDWLLALCQALFSESASRPAVESVPMLRLIDSTLVKEPGPTGSQWRIHYSLQWPGLNCDYFKITATEGKGTGEALSQYPLRTGEHLLADRGYCRAQDIHHAAAQGAKMLIRLNPGGIRLTTEAGMPFALLQRLNGLTKTGQIHEWPVWLPLPGAAPLPVRLCVIRKNKTAIARALKKLRREASKDHRTLQPETLRYAEFIMVLTTFPVENFPASRVLDYYRFRWQIELLFKRFKQLAELGHLPKYDDDSSQAWLYGKLFVALLTEKLIAHARDFSPWGYPLQTPSQSLARVRLR
jgi:hypothetical protein